MMDEHLLQTIDEGDRVLSWAMLIEQQPRHRRTLRAKTLEQ